MSITRIPQYMLDTSGPAIPLVFNTLADAIASPLTPLAATIRTTGRVTVGDGGGGTYVRATSSRVLGFQDTASNYWDLADPICYPEHGGAIAAGSTANGPTNKTAFQRCADDGREFVIPAKTYYVDPTVTFTKGGCRGIKGRSVVYCTGTSSADLFITNTQESCVFQDVYFQCGGAKSGGAAIHLNSTTNSNNRSRVMGCIFASYPTGVMTTNAQDYTITDNYFANYLNGLIVQNDVSPDGGDSRVFANMFATTNPSAKAIYQINSGGLKIQCNKILGGAYGYYLDAKGGTSMTTQSTSILLIESNSFEHQSAGAINLQRAGSADSSISFFHVIISGNQLNGNQSSGTAQPNVVGIATNLNLKWLVFSSNTVQLSQYGGTGLTISVASRVAVYGNIFDTGGSGVGTGVSTGANVYGYVGKNDYGGSLAAAYAITNTTNTAVINGG